MINKTTTIQVITRRLHWNVLMIFERIQRKATLPRPLRFPSINVDEGGGCGGGVDRMQRKGGQKAWLSIG